MADATSTQTLPSRSIEAIENDLHHWICCDPDTALCGMDVSNQPWVDKEITCPMCPEGRCPICGESVDG